MMWNDTLQRILDDLQTETKEDLVGLWLLQGWVQDALPELNTTAVREATLMVVEKALEGGEVVAGSFIDHDVAIWPTQDVISHLTSDDPPRRCATQVPPLPFTEALTSLM
jgi:hypothetical protein